MVLVVIVVVVAGCCNEKSCCCDNVDSQDSMREVRAAFVVEEKISFDVMSGVVVAADVVTRALRACW